MANYVLTQTGQEVQDILDSMGATYFFSQTATFASDNTYADYPYKGTISLVGVDGTMGVEVTFSNDQAISGNYSPICNTTNDAVEIWSKVNTSITIPTIKIYKNGYVNLNGSSNYMPQSGGNFTGAISVNNSAVVTMGNVTTITPTFASDVTNGDYTYCQKFGRVVCVGINFQLTANRTTKSALISGLPAPAHGYALVLNSDTTNMRAILNTNGEIRNDTSNVTASWYNGSITYISAT